MYKSITYYGVDPRNSGGVSRYARELHNNIPSQYYITKSYEIKKNNKLHFGLISKLINQFENIKSDIIHSISAVSLYYKSSVVTIHDLYFNNKAYKTSIMAFMTPALLKWKLGRLKIIVPTELVLKQFEELFGSKENVYVVHHGVNFDYIDKLELYNPFETSDNIVIPGGVDFRRRNQRVLLDKLKETNYNVYVVGYGFMDVLKNEYKKYENLHFCKDVSDRDFYSYLKFSDLNLYNTVGEGFGYIIYESLYLGNKMLVNYNEDNKMLFNNYAEYYTDNLMDLIDEKLKKKIDRKEDLLKNYSIRNMVERTLSLYETV